MVDSIMLMQLAGFLPVSSDNKPVPTGIEAQVCEDIAKRQQLGIAKYGTTVADNPLDLLQWLGHLYEELLDAAVYTKRSIEQMKVEMKVEEPSE